MSTRPRPGPPRALLFPDANFLAHVSRLLEIAKVLRAECGFECVFAGDGRYLDLAREEGFATTWCFTVPKETTLALARDGFLVDPVWWNRAVSRSIESDADAITQWRPDVVVGDMHWSLRAAAAERGVPYASLVNAAWTNYSGHEVQALDDHVMTRALGRPLATRLFPLFRALALWYWALPYKLWKRRRGHREVATGNLFDVVTGDVTLLADVPELSPTGPLPESVRYVGPILWRPRAGAPEWLARLDPGRPTVYVSMGSTGKEGSFATAVRAFGGTEYQLVMTTGEIALGAEPLPANVFAAEFAPGDAILAHADVSVNHGGNGTIYQALAAGVPIVGIPTHVDQQVQLQLVERAGVGRKVAESALGPDALRAAVASVLADGTMRENARRLARAIAAYDGARTAALAVQDLARARPRAEEPEPARAEAV